MIYLKVFCNNYFIVLRNIHFKIMIYSTISFPLVVSKTNKQIYFIYFLRVLYFCFLIGLFVLGYYIDIEVFIPFFGLAFVLFGLIGCFIPETVKIEGKLRISSEAIVYMSKEQEVVYEMEHVKSLTIMYDGYLGQNRSISNYSFCSGNDNEK